MWSIQVIAKVEIIFFMFVVYINVTPALCMRQTCPQFKKQERPVVVESE